MPSTPLPRPPSTVALPHPLGRLSRNLALQDAAVLLMLARLSYVGLRHPAAPSQTWLPVLSLLAIALTTLLCVRGNLLEAGPLRALCYRLGMLLCVGGSYFALRPLLPILEPELLDRELLALDVRLFARTPAVWLDRFVTSASVEWFAFFYYSFYALLGAFVLGTLLLDRGRRRYELLLTVTLVMTVGHVGYTWVPGVGPHACPDLQFQHALSGGIWWSRVQRAVQDASARYDIFPSLHTALSVAIAAHAIRHRRQAPFCWVWGLITFWVVNIVIATVFLRWHYGVDVLAGLMLAVVSHAVALHAWRDEDTHDADWQQPVWESLLPAHVATEDRHWIVGVFAIQLLVCVGLLVAS